MAERLSLISINTTSHGVCVCAPARAHTCVRTMRHLLPALLREIMYSDVVKVIFNSNLK